MTYSTDLVKDISYEDILKKVTEYDIFKYYINYDFTLNRIFSSPFRNDEHPSFGIFKSSKSGELLFKDQATGDSGNCIHFVMKLFNLTYFQTLKKVWQDIILKKVSYTEKGNTIRKYKAPSTEILVQKRNWCKYDTEYWGQYSITKEDLKEYNVFPIDRFYINGILQDYKYQSTSPMYCYFIFDKIKIYRPYADKSDKWRSSAGTYDIQGYEQLPDKVDHLIITKSLKDVIVLHKLGYWAIAPNGENHDVPKCIIDKLIKDKGVNKFTIFYDNDKPGIVACAKLIEKFNFDAIGLSLEYGCKDISDYVKLYGLEKAKEWLQQRL